jgi:MFS family permease
VSNLKARVAVKLEPEQAEENSSFEPQPAKTAPGFLHAFKSLSVPGYRTLWLGMLFNMASMQINIVARSWLAYDLSGSALILGVVAMARGLPQIIFSPLGGVAADRFDKRKVLVISQTILCVLALANALLVQTGVIRVWHLIAIGLLQGITFPFTMPTRQALIPQLVSGDDLPNALAMDSAGRNLNRVVAPSIAGVLIAWDPVVAFYTVAVFYFVSAFTLLRLPSTASTVDPSRSAMQQMIFGFRYMIGRRRLLILIGMAFVAVILGMPFQQMLPVFQAAVLNVGPEKLGFMYAAVGAGALVGSLTIAYRSDDPRRQRYQLIAGVCFGVLLIPFALSKHLGLSLAMLALIGLCSEIFMTINRMLVLLNTDSHLYGRVMGTYAMTFSLMPIASLPMGALVDAIGAPRTVAAAGFLLALAVLIMSFILPRIWHKDIAPQTG